MLAQWENGHRGLDEPYRELFCSLYESTPDALGLPPVASRARPDIALTYSLSLEETTVALEDLGHFDLIGHTGVVLGRYSPEALNAVCLDWLVAPTTDDLKRSNKTVSAKDMAEIQIATATFDNLDRQFGGNHARSLATHYLHDAVIPRLRGKYTEEIGQELFSSAAVLCELIGWMAYDGSRHSLAQRYFTQALRLAEAGGHKAYAGFILTSMSHQALYLQHPGQALRLARVATDLTERVDIPALSAEASALEARAHADLGSARACGLALARAETHLDRCNNTNTPSWAKVFTEGVFASYSGACWLALNHLDKAEQSFTLLLKQAGDQNRRRVYANVQLAIGALADGDIDSACEWGTKAVQAAERLKSQRSTEQIEALTRRLRPYADRPAVQELQQQVHETVSAST